MFTGRNALLALVAITIEANEEGVAYTGSNIAAE